MSIQAQVPEFLRRGRRALDSLVGVTLLQDWSRARSGSWFLELALDIGSKASSEMPSQTRWHLVATDSYPDGPIEIYPSRLGGITTTTTFHHQSHNSPSSEEDRPWTRGNLCLVHPSAGVLRKLSQDEPFDIDARLKWRVERAFDWLALLPTLRAQPQSTLMVTTSGLAFVLYPPGPVYSATKAFLHNWLDALRVQLRKTSVEVLELAPPYVQTELGGPKQASDPRAMPLDEFTMEVMQILENGAFEKGEILVDKVKSLRTAEKDGKYQEYLDIFAAMHD